MSDMMTSGVVLAVEVADDANLSANSGTLLAGTLLALNSATENLTPFVKGGTDIINGVPVAVLPNELVSDGTVQTTLVLRRGQVKASLLVIDADGDGSNIDEAVEMQIRDAGIDPLAV